MQQDNHIEKNLTGKQSAQALIKVLLEAEAESHQAPDRSGFTRHTSGEQNQGCATQHLNSMTHAGLLATTQPAHVDERKSESG